MNEHGFEPLSGAEKMQAIIKAITVDAAGSDLGSASSVNAWYEALRSACLSQKVQGLDQTTLETLTQWAQDQKTRGLNTALRTFREEFRADLEPVISAFEKEVSEAENESEGIKEAYRRVYLKIQEQQGELAQLQADYDKLTRAQRKDPDAGIYVDQFLSSTQGTRLAELRKKSDYFQYLSRHLDRNYDWMSEELEEIRNEVG